MSENKLIFGTAGSGKTEFAKKLINKTRKENPDTKIYVVTNGQDYTGVSDFSRVMLGMDTTFTLNPLDTNNAGTDPVLDVGDFTADLFELIRGKKCSSFERGAIMYAMEKMFTDYPAETVNTEDGVGYREGGCRNTLSNLYQFLLEGGSVEAQNLAFTLEPYAAGRKNFFSYRTHRVFSDNPVQVFDLGYDRMGYDMNAFAMICTLRAIWQNVAGTDRPCMIILDDITSDDPVFMRMIMYFFKRAKKHNITLVGISQDIIGMYEANKELFYTVSDFIFFNQMGDQRKKIREMFTGDGTELEYVTNSAPGCGIRFTGQNYSRILGNDK